MSGILYTMIHALAEADKPDVEITAANYHIWVAHWFKSAETLAKDFESEGLTETAKAVRDIIVDQRKLLGNKYETQSPSSAPSTR